MLSPCHLLPFQPSSFLSPPEKGNHGLGSSTMERALVFAFCFQQLGAARGETSILQHVSQSNTWPRERCLELGGSSQGWLGTETSTHPTHVDEWVWGLKGGDEV